MHHALEFVLPVVFASGEAMIWVLLIVVLIAVGRGRILPSEKTLFIDRPGRYSMKLAPGLNLVQPFVEALAEQLLTQNIIPPEGAKFCFEIADKHIKSRKHPCYLLQISTEQGLLRFEARQGLPDTLPHQNAEAIENAIRTTGKNWAVELCASA